MNCAVRYYSRSGNTKLIADEIARSLDIKAVSVDDPASNLISLLMYYLSVVHFMLMVLINILSHI